MNKLFKEFAKRMYEIIYILFRIFPVKENRIIFESYYGKNISCNPKVILNYMIEENSDNEYIVVHNKKHNESELNGKVKYVKLRTLKYFYYYATSRVWVLNTHQSIILKPKKNQIYLQTWHAAGAFKKFGKSATGERLLEKKRWLKDAKNWTYLLCSNDNIKDIYSEAFDIPLNKIVCTGIPRNDIFLYEDERKKNREILNKRINNIDNKKIILYAPTFRDNREFSLELNFDNLYKELNKEYKLLLKLHPNIKDNIEIDEKYSDFIYDFSNYEETQDLLLASDLLITDYSSIIFDFAITGNPIIFYAYDLEEYADSIRGFYYKYDEFVPGPIVKTSDELVSILKNYEDIKFINSKKVYDFAKKYNKNSENTCIQEVVKLLGRN